MMSRKVFLRPAVTEMFRFGSLADISPCSFYRADTAVKRDEFGREIVPIVNVAPFSQLRDRQPFDVPYLALSILS